MTNYGRQWQASKKFADDFENCLLTNADDKSEHFSAFAFAHELNTHLETRADLMCDFAVKKVASLSGARVVRARLQPKISVDGQTFTKISNNTGVKFQRIQCTSSTSIIDCNAYLLVRFASKKQSECAAILTNKHRHQRVSERCASARI